MLHHRALTLFLSVTTPLHMAAAVEPLLSATDVAEVMSAADVRIIEVVNDQKGYDNGHLPGALAMDWVEDLTDVKHRDRYTNPSQERLEELMSKLGITPDMHVIVYDDLGSRLSTRAYWTLKVYGHRKVSVLNGGKSAWTRAGQPLSKEPPKMSATSYRANKPDPRIQVTAAEIKKHIGVPTTVIIDGRPSKQYAGSAPGAVFHTGKSHARLGHIPGAVNITWTDNFNEDGTFKSPDELKALYEGQKITPDKTVMTYCNEGIHAAPPWFVLQELLGYPDVRVYDDSMAEWANSPDFPLARTAD